MAKNNNGALSAATAEQAGNLGFEWELWQADDALRLIFLKYISDELRVPNADKFIEEAGI